MKFNTAVSSQADKVRKAFFTATKDAKHVAMSAPLSKEMRETYGVKALPIRRGDEVRVVRGKYQDREGAVTAVKLSTMRIEVENVSTEKVTTQQVSVPIHPSNVVITKVKMDKHRNELIERKRAGRKAVLAKLGK